MAASAAGPAVDIAAAMVTRTATLADWLVILPVVVPLMTGAIIVMLRHRTGLHAAIAAVGLLILFAADVALLARVMAEGPVLMMMGAWLPPFGIAFEADMTGTLLATTSALVALCVTLTAGPTVNTAEKRYGFHVFKMLLMAGVSGAFLTGDIFNLYVWFEVLLISSYGLLILGSEPRQIDATVKYGLLNLMATTLFLIAVGLLYGTLGTLNMADIAVKAASGDSSGPLMTVTVLLVLAFAMKAAAFPVNFWLPASYHAPPAAVSALFAGLLTKVGVYALLKTALLLLPAQAVSLQPLLALAAGLTIVIGAAGALAETELRRALNWLVVSGIGNMLIAVSVSGEGAVTGALFYAIHSMVVMAALYLAAGVVEEIAGSGDLRRLGGLWVSHPAFSALILVLCLAVAGLPPFSGFWPKAMLFEAALAGGRPWLAASVLAGGFLTTLAVGRLFLFAVWRGGPEGTPDGQVVAPVGAVASGDIATRIQPIGVLVAIIVAIGLVPAPLHGAAADAAAGLVNPGAFIDAVFGATP